MPCGVSDEQCHAAVRRQPEWSRGVRTGTAERVRSDQPGDGGLCKLDGTAFRGAGACDRACWDCRVFWDVTQERWLSPCRVFVGMGLGASSSSSSSAVARVAQVLKPGKSVWCVWVVCRVVFQSDGWTPLHIASMTGRVECVQALLGVGGAINQAAVGCASSTAQGTVCVRDAWEPAFAHAHRACCARMRRFSCSCCTLCVRVRGHHDQRWQHTC